MSGVTGIASPDASAFWDAHCVGPAEAIVRAALDEDLGEGGDITTLTVAHARGIEFRPDTRIVAREHGIVCGIRAAQVVCMRLGASIEPACADGAATSPGCSVARVHGPPGAVLAAERTLLNMVGLLSGTATLTASFVQRARGTRAVIMDTRKTLPGMRALQKYAVLCGGGMPHRMGLHDAFLAKDNHLAGLDPAGIAALVRECSGPARARGARFVECEVDSLDQLDALLVLEPGFLDVALLDNFNCDALQESVARRDRIAPHVKLEASGGVTLETVAGVARTGVDRISVGALTHSVRSIDFGLDAA
jgi:nicotinate-nucleotide pyrophosphorylase (carboxylating)